MRLNARWPFRSGAVAFLATLLAASLSAQQPNSVTAALAVNGMAGPPYPIAAPGLENLPVTLALQGGPAAAGLPFLVAVAPVVPGIAPTPFGIVDVDFTAPCFAAPLNGFDPANPLAPLSFLSFPAASFQITFVRPAGSLLVAGLQGLIVDPAAPAGARLTAAAAFAPGGLSLFAIDPPADVAAGGVVAVVSGQGFSCGAIAVTFNGVPSPSVTVLSEAAVSCIVPASPSGPGPAAVMVTQLTGSAVLNGAFQYVPAGSLPSALVEDFNGNQQEDLAFVPVFNSAAWNWPLTPGRLAGRPISGSALATFQGNPAQLGSRIQVTVNAPLPAPSFALFSPFDDAFGNNLGVNPGGGSRIMHLYQGVDLSGIRDSLELVEWGPANNFVIGTTYASYTAWCGMSSFTGAPTPGAAGQGMIPVFGVNYDIPTPQPADPAGAGGVLVTPTTSYATGPGAVIPGGYFPFPLFNPPFDYLGSGPGSGSLILEQNIEPGAHVANFNRAWAFAILPVRRLLGFPLSSGQALAIAAEQVTYDMRFTFVGLNSSSQSLFYDTGSTSPLGPTYLAGSLVPDPRSQPAGTTTRFELESASAILAPNQPAAGSSSGFVPWWDGDPASGGFNAAALNGIQGGRYLRFRASFRGNNLTNQVPDYDRFTLYFLP